MNNIPNRFHARLMDCYADHQAQFNEMMLQMEMEFTGRLDAGRLAKAVDLVLDAEPVLGCRFVDSGKHPFFERLDAGKRSAFIMANGEGEYCTFRLRPIAHKAGPLINVCLWPSPHGDRLMLKVAHHVADAAGVKDIAAILSGIYRQLSKDPAYCPSANVKEHRTLRQVVRHVPPYAYPRIFLSSMKVLWATYKPHTIHSLATSDGPREPLTYVTRFIPSARVSSLTEYGHSHGATLNDIMATAALRATVSVQPPNPASHICLHTTIDLRRYIPSGRAAAVANLSYLIMYWPNLGTRPGRDFGATLDRVARTTRQGKKHWFGLDIVFEPFNPVVKMMSHAGAMKIYREYVEVSFKKQAGAHWFTNMGPIETESVDFGLQPSRAWLLPPVAYPPSPFMFSLSGHNGALTLAAGAYPTQKEPIERFFDAMLKELPA
jgi:NRPS condensation-like uncharacterized protein